MNVAAAKASPGDLRRSRRWLLAFCTASGLFAGLSIFSFGYGGGAAYLGSDSAACANCHVMQDAYQSWLASSHHSVAVCNDCHLSHHPVGKWVTKADNGFFHSLAFTTGDFPDPIRIKPRNSDVTQAACLYCHSEFTHGTGLARDDSVRCVHCHRSVGHAQR